MTQEIFRNLDADDPDPETTEIESLCMSCYERGITRLLLTKIPFYKEVVIMSFTCDSCGYQNNEIQPGGKIQPKGLRIELSVKTPKDLNRRVVKSDYSGVRIVELDFEIPPMSQKGEVTTVEGIIERVITGLEQDQEPRRIDHPEAAKQIDDFIGRLRQLKELDQPFTLILEDASGNAFLENPMVPSSDPQMKITHFVRSKEQDKMLGLYDAAEVNAQSNLSTVNEEPTISEEPTVNGNTDETEGAKNEEVIIEAEKLEENGAVKSLSEDRNVLKMISEDSFPLEGFDKEVLRFNTDCPDCNAPCDTNMKITNIPHFKEVVIMATVCENCGHKTNEVKCSGGIEEKGIRIDIKVRTREDFSRDILKSEFCSLSIPELEVEVGPHALGGRFTTVEGLLQAMKEQLLEQSSMFFDTQDVDQKKRMDTFFTRFDLVLNNQLPVTIVLDDPTGNSFVQSVTDDVRDDEGLRFFHYHRSHEQNEELGLNDMKTEGYEQIDEEEEEEEDKDNS